MPAIPPKPKPAGDNRNLVTVDENYAAPGLEDHLRLFWEKNARLILTIILAVAVVMVGRGFYQVMQERHAEGVQADYAAATTDSQLKDFIAANPADPLAGVAQLQLADRAYTAGNFSEAQAGYAKALPQLGGTPLAPRAQLGAAVSLLQAGQTEAGRTALTQLANASSLPKATRTEAAYDLAVIAAAAGHTDEVGRLTLQIINIDPGSPFAKRAGELSTLVPSPSTTPAPSTPGAAPSSALAPAPSSAPAPKSEAPPAVIFTPPAP
jgi:predicted negative regulator of RcsB-dependent stress response